MLKVLDKNHQILLKENMKAAPEKITFFLAHLKLPRHIFEGTTITPLNL